MSGHAVELPAELDRVLAVVEAPAEGGGGGPAVHSTVQYTVQYSTVQYSTVPVHAAPHAHHSADVGAEGLLLRPHTPRRVCKEI